jgi:hypothetical protein
MHIQLLQPLQTASQEARIANPRQPGESDAMNGLTFPGNKCGLNSEGFDEFNDNTIYISKHTIRAWWNNNKERLVATLYAEWYNSESLYNGNVDELKYLLGNDKGILMQHYREWNFLYNNFPSLHREAFKALNYYLGKLLGF